jgi:hypothetical protein
VIKGGKDKQRFVCSNEENKEKGCGPQVSWFSFDKCDDCLLWIYGVNDVVIMIYVNMLQIFFFCV